MGDRQPELFVAPKEQPTDDAVCGVCLGPHFPSDEPKRFCEKPALWRWTHLELASAVTPYHPFSVAIIDYYCQEHGDWMRDQGGFGDIGMWEGVVRP